MGLTLIVAMLSQFELQIAFMVQETSPAITFIVHVLFCEENGGPRQQFNALTHFVDASQVRILKKIKPLKGQ